MTLVHPQAAAHFLPCLSCQALERGERCQHPMFPPPFTLGPLHPCLPPPETTLGSSQHCPYHPGVTPQSTNTPSPRHSSFLCPDSPLASDSVLTGGWIWGPAPSSVSGKPLCQAAGSRWGVKATAPIRGGPCCPQASVHPEAAGGHLELPMPAAHALCPPDFPSRGLGLLEGGCPFLPGCWKAT